MLGRVSAPYQSQAYPIDREPPRRRSTVGWIAIILFGFLAGIGAIGAIAAVGVYSALASPSGMPDPKTLETYVLPQEVVVLDRTGHRELARFGEARREIVTFDQIPRIVLDATTARSRSSRPT
jgi:membrane carboxypeptidase/penicillin-binding protein